MRNRSAKRILMLAAFTLQLGSMRCVYAQALRTPEQGLAAHHIPLDPASVVAALRNPDPQVRWLAAEKLGGWGGGDKDMDAIPAIESALSEETNVQAKINIAAVLASLRDEKGLEALASICEEQGVPLYKRLDAARHVFESGGSGCSNTILEALKGGPDSDPAIRQQALSFVSHLPKQSALDTARYIESNELRDSNPVVRAAASASLVEIGDIQSLKTMRDVLSQETDQYARTTMQTSIDSLEKKVVDLHSH